MSYEPLSLDRFKAPPPRDHGAAASLQWVQLADLVVDKEYQRDITVDMRRKIHKIAAEFDWSCFAPLIVSPVTGGKFAVIDGQGRATAALLVGETQAPALVVIADRVRQARSFAAINGTITKMSSMAVYRAARAAGDPVIAAIDAIATSQGVRVLTYPVAAANQRPGDTMAVMALIKSYSAHGGEALRMGLCAIMASRGDKRGLFSDVMVKALPFVFRERPMALETIRAAFGHIDLRLVETRAREEGSFGPVVDIRDEVKRRLVRLANGRA